MERSLVLLVSLVLVSFCSRQEWTPEDLCQQKRCPNYSVVGTHEGFEERFYNVTDWITTKMDSSGVSDTMAAYSRLKDYCRRWRGDGCPIPADTWPVLITVTNGTNYFMSWFVPPGTESPENTDPSVTLQSRPKATIYVKFFDGIPSIKRGEANAKRLRQALVKAGKTFDNHTYSGAGYESYFALTHHNEIWIQAA